MPSNIAATKNLSKWKSVKCDTSASTPISDMVYAPVGNYGVTFSEEDNEIVCRILDVCEGTLTIYSMCLINEDNEDQTAMKDFLHGMKIVNSYLVDDAFLVLIVYSAEDRQLSHIGFSVNHEEKKLIHQKEDFSVSPVEFTDGRVLTNDDVYHQMPWKSGCAPLVMNGQKFVVISTSESIIINKWKPDSAVIGRQISNQCDDVKENYLFGATPFCYGSKIYFLLHQVQHFIDANGIERRRLYADRLGSMDISAIDSNGYVETINDDHVEFDFIPLRKLSEGDFCTTFDTEMKQQGRFLVIHELKMSTRNKKRPALYRRVFTIDLSEMSTMEHCIRMRNDAFATIIPGGFLVYRSKPDGEKTKLEYKVEEIKSRKVSEGPLCVREVPSLQTLAFHNSLMNSIVPKELRFFLFK